MSEERRGLKYREEFEQLGVFELTKRVHGALYDEDKNRAARVWLDEQEHGEERAYRVNNFGCSAAPT